MVMEVGRVCVKLAGNEAGKQCVIVDVLDNVYVVVSGPGVKRRRCNIAHLEPLEQKVEIAKGVSDEDVKRTLEVKIEKPSDKPSEPKEDTA